MNRKSKYLVLERGFTLIELLVVISIISLLSAIIFTNLSDARLRAHDAKIKTLAHNLQTAVEIYYLAHGNYGTQAVFDDEETGSCFRENSIFFTEPGIKLIIDDLAPYYTNSSGNTFACAVWDSDNIDTNGYSWAAHFKLQSPYTPWVCVDWRGLTCTGQMNDNSDETVNCIGC